MTGAAGARADAHDAAAHTVENPPEVTAVKVAAMKRKLADLRALCESQPTRVVAVSHILAILDREG